MRSTKPEQLGELVEALVEDAINAYVAELMEHIGVQDNSTQLAAAFIAKARRRIAMNAAGRMRRRDVVQRVADIIRGRAPGRL